MENVPNEINNITFSLFGPKTIKNMAAAKVVTPELYDREGYPVDGGLMDIRLGVIDPGIRCKTCGSKLKECLGHFGYIELARPVVHVKFVPTILSILRSTCNECSKLLVSDEELEDAKKLLKNTIPKLVLKSLKLGKSCPHCKSEQGKIMLEKPTTFLEVDKRISPIEVRSRLEKVPDDALPVFGINPEAARPEWPILTVLAIPPVTMRPSITLESGERSEDDLTHKLADIVRINQRLFENINAGAPEIIIEDLWDLLQYHITTFFDNNLSQLPPARHRSGEPLKTLTERITSKEGRIRHNLAGKRTNFSARTVISPDPKIEMDEVGVPIVMALKLTVPERITEWNLNYLKKFVENGPKVYPGANYIVRPDGKKKKITDDTKEQLLEEIEPGFQVERHLIDGDVALFNRQPSLHRMSMMCHKVKVLPGLTLRLNPAVCAPYAADFDGDEMNLHIPQTEEARAEAEILLEVETQVISPRYGLSIIGCNQDSVSGNYVLTKYLDFPRSEAIDLLASIGVTDFSKLPKKEIVSGKEVFSVLLPKDFNFEGHAKSYKPGSKNSDDFVKIEKGVLKTGVLDSKNIGGGSGLLLRNLHKQYGQERALKMLGLFFRLGIQTLLKYGFSSSLSDTDLTSKASKEVENIILESEKEVNKLIKKYNQKTLVSLPGRGLRETLELKILEVLNRARNDAGKVVFDTADVMSHTYIMVDSGARGNEIQLAQMAACVGQQAFRGSRINQGFGGRTLSCFKKNDLSPKAHGFVRGGYKSGLKPHEFFFMNMTGRDSLMDTALRTPKSGYLYRRLANAMQDLKVEYDFTVRDAANKIVQFTYGEDGIDVSKSEGGSINIKKIVDTVIKG